MEEDVVKERTAGKWIKSRLYYYFRLSNDEVSGLVSTTIDAR